MKRMDCLSEEFLNRYADGELPPEEEAVAASHLKECSLCHSQMEGIKAVGEILRADIARLSEDADFSLVWAGVRDGVSEGLKHPEEPSWLRRLLAGVRAATEPAMATAALVVLAGAIYLAATIQPPPPLPPPVLEAGVSHSAQILTLETDSRVVMVLQSPKSGATIIIVNDEGPDGNHEEQTI